MLSNETQIKIKTLLEIEGVNQHLDFGDVMDGLVYSADQIRDFALNSTEDTNEKNCALNNLYSILAAMNYIAQTNHFILTAKSWEAKSC